jgi:hypothetical protein
MEMQIRIHRLVRLLMAMIDQKIPQAKPGDFQKSRKMSNSGSQILPFRDSSQIHRKFIAPFFRDSSQIHRLGLCKTLAG